MVYGLNEVNRTVMLRASFRSSQTNPSTCTTGIVQRAVTQQNVIHITEPRALWSFRLLGLFDARQACDCEIGDDVPTHPAPEVPPPACNVRDSHCFPEAPLVIQGVLWKSGVPSDGSKNVLFLNVETDATNNPSAGTTGRE
jgi:hypothetical protein